MTRLRADPRAQRASARLAGAVAKPVAWRARHIGGATLALGLARALVLLDASATAPHPPVVYAATVDSIIHPVSAEYMIDTIDRADQT
ncbi:MAG: hypothetical protein ACRD2N_00525, partial [Vicinamibacterales bacterium]